MVINFQMVSEVIRDVEINKNLNVFEALKFLEAAGYTIPADATVKVVHTNSSCDEITDVAGRKLQLQDGDTIVTHVSDVFMPNFDKRNRDAAVEAAEKEVINAYDKVLEALEAYSKAASLDKAPAKQEEKHTCKCGGKCHKKAAASQETVISFTGDKVEVLTKKADGTESRTVIAGDKIVIREADGVLSVTAK
jgi:hypothetical protein